ncbi:MAG: hypothetical protein WB383_03130 [Acidimicrobiales bacterium]
MKKRDPVAAPVAPVAPPAADPARGDDPYDVAVRDLALRERDRILDQLNESTVLSNRAQLIDAAVALAGTASAEWYLTADIAAAGDGGGPGLGNLVRHRAKAGRALRSDEFVFVAAVCTFFYLFGVMADRDRLPAARTFVREIGAPEALGDVARELEYAYPTRRPSPRPKTTMSEYLARADEYLAGFLEVDNRPGLSAGQAATVMARFGTLYHQNVVPVVSRVR